MSRTDEDPRRPSRLQLDRFATGELKGAERAAVQQGLEIGGFQHLEELKAARKQVRPFDAAAIRARAAAMEAPAATRAPALPTMADLVLDEKIPDELPNLFPEREDDKATHPFAEERGAFPARDDAAAEIVEEDAADAIFARMPSAMSAPPMPRDAKPANGVRWLLAAVPALVLAAAVALVVLPAASTTTEPLPAIAGDAIRAKGDQTLAVYTLDGGDLHPYQGQALGQGDVVGFQVVAAGQPGVVLLSVDGAGEVSVYWPASGDAPEPLAGDAGPTPLPGTVTLDAARGPEVFVAVFGHPVAWAREQAATAWAAGGASGVAEWARAEADADAVVVEKR